MNRAIIAVCVWLTLIVVAGLIWVDGAADATVCIASQSLTFGGVPDLSPVECVEIGREP